MGMSNFSYQKQQDYPDCETGVWECSIVDIRRGATKWNAATIDFYIGPADKEARWNGVPFRKSVIDNDYFDKNWSKMCDCFGVPPEKAGEAIHNFPLFANRKGKFKFSFEKREQQTTGYNPDGTAKTEWVNVPTEYMQIEPLKPTTKLSVGPLKGKPQTQAQSQGFQTQAPQAQSPRQQLSHAGQAQLPLSDNNGGFPEDIPF